MTAPLSLKPYLEDVERIASLRWTGQVTVKPTLCALVVAEPVRVMETTEGAVLSIV